MTIAAAQLGMTGSAKAQSNQAKRAARPASKAGNTSLNPLKQVEAGLLHVGYEETGPAGGPPASLDRLLLFSIALSFHLFHFGKQLDHRAMPHLFRGILPLPEREVVDIRDIAG